MRCGHDNIARLAEAIRRIEGGRADPPLRGGEVAVARAVSGAPAPRLADVWPPAAALRRGCVHEWFACAPTADAHSSGAAEGGDARPPLCLLVDLARQCAADQRGVRGRWAIWLGRWCWPYAPLLARTEGRPAPLIDQSLFVDPPDADTRLWAMELSVRSEAVSVLVADGRGLSMAATRRLQLAAEAGRAQVLLARSPAERKALSAAAMRWGVAPVSAPGDRPRWRIELMRCKGVQWQDGTEAGRIWDVEWNSAQGRVVAPADVVDRARASPARGASPVARVSA